MNGGTELQGGRRGALPGLWRYAARAAGGETESTMLDIGNSFNGFLDALFGFLNDLLNGLFGFLTDLLNGIQINF